MKCPKCSFTHEVLKFCPFCGVSLVDEEQSNAGGEGPGPPDTTEHQDSPAVPSRQVAQTSRYDGQLFQCQLPFSWLIRELVDKLWQDARAMTAQTSESVQEVLRNTFDETEIGRQLSKVTRSSIDPAEVMMKYIHDYVLMTHKITTDSEVEVRLICRAVEHTVFMERKKIQQTPHITDVHVAVDDGVRGCLSRFSLLMEFWPDQLPTLETEMTNRSNMKLDVAALRLVLENLAQELWQLTTAKDKQPWGSKLQSVSLLAEDLLAAYKVGSPEQQQDGQLQHSLYECRCSLTRLRVVKLYLDHLCGTDEPLPMHQVQRLWNYLGDGPDFKTKPTVKKLEGFLVLQSKEAASKHFSEALKKHQDFRRRSNAFFMDVVSMFCFADDAPPQQDVIHMLLGYIVREVDDTRARTKGFSLFKEECVDRTPSIRHFLLQLLLRFKFADVCEHLESYFEGVRVFAGSVEDAIEVCIIFVQCMENALSSQVDRTPGRQAHLIEHAASELERAARRCKEFPEIALMLQLNMIASIRFGLSVACDVMNIEVSHPKGGVVNYPSQRSLRRLFDNVRSLLSDFDAVTRWPKLFIPKYLYRRHGLDTLLSVGRSPRSQWFLPEEMCGNQEAVVPDRFVVYGEAYQRIREATAKAILTNDINEIVHSLRKPDIPQQDKEVLALLAIYTEVKLAVVSTEQNVEVVCQMQQMLEMFSRCTGVIRNKELKELAERLIQNNDAGHCTKLSFRPNQPPREQSVSALIVHVGTVLAAIPSNPLLEPLKALAAEPQKMMSYYLPTMPEDPLPEVKEAFADQQVFWYQCPNGHHYVIGECARPYHVGKCHCGAVIGGTNYKLAAGNLPGRKDDATSTGHIIGDAQDRPVNPIPERQLSPFATVITRLVLHAAMLNGANKNPQPFTNLIHPVPVDINDFLWRHVNRDIYDLARVLGRSFDDATLLVHILLTSVPHSDAAGVWNVTWTSIQGRKNWEEAFNNVYIKPLPQNLDSRLQEANRLVDGDRRLIDTSFHRVLHDNTTPPDQLSLENVIGLSEMWQYRPSVSLEHMSRCFVEHQPRFPLLKMFLDNAIILSALSHLPDIIHLTTLLRTRYHRNIDLTEALTMKIAVFLKSLPEGPQRDECDMLVKRFGDIWITIRPLLLQQEQIHRPKNMDPVIDVQTTSVYHLLPMKEDATVMSCMTAVVLFLVRKNNEFLDIYQKKACIKDDGTLRRWTDVSAGNVVSCDPARDLMPLVLSHCNYSLAIGKGTQVGYDFAALEKQLIDRFLYGKCKIVEKCETFQFRQEARDVAMFAAVRKQIPQETISMPIKRQVVLESASLENVCVSLGAVDIAIFFLASAGGDGDKLVSEYLHRVLKMGKASRLHSNKVRDYCRLKHALSLWQLLSVQRARLLLANGQDPFDNVDSSYTKQLEEEQITALENALKNMDLNTLSAELYEFLVVSDDKEKRKPEWSLRATLESYLDEKDAPEINGFLSHFPESILLEHACDTWRILANYNQEEVSTFGATPLREAFPGGHVGAAEPLLKTRVQVDSRDWVGDTSKDIAESTDVPSNNARMLEGRKNIRQHPATVMMVGPNRRKVGPEGGELQTESCTVTVPHGAVNMETEITCQVINPNDVTLPLEDGAILMSDIIELGPHGTTFNQPVTVQMQYSSTLPGARGAMEAVVLVTEDRAQWVELTTTKLSENEISVSVDHCSIFAVISQPKQDQFTVSTEECTLTSSAQPAVQISFPEGAMTTPTQVTIQVQEIPKRAVEDMKAKDQSFPHLVGTSPIVTVETESDSEVEFLKPVTVQVPHPKRYMDTQHEVPDKNLKVMSHEKGTENWIDETDNSNPRGSDEFVEFEVHHCTRWIVIIVNDNYKGPEELGPIPLNLCRWLQYRDVQFILLQREDNMKQVVIECTLTDNAKEKRAELMQEGYKAPLPSSTVNLFEGQRVEVKLVGNVGIAFGLESNEMKQQITFHSQQSNRLHMQVMASNGQQGSAGEGIAAFFSLPRVEVTKKKGMAARVRKTLEAVKDKPPKGFDQPKFLCDLPIDVPYEPPKPTEDACNTIEGVEKCFYYTKEAVSTDWIDLAFHLGFKWADITNIAGRNPDGKSRCMDMLQEWKKRKGDTATAKVLLEALTEAELQSTVDGLKNKFPDII